MRRLPVTSGVDLPSMEGAMRDPQLDIYDPKTLAVMNQAFAAI